MTRTGLVLAGVLVAGGAAVGGMRILRNGNTAVAQAQVPSASGAASAAQQVTENNPATSQPAPQPVITDLQAASVTEKVAQPPAVPAFAPIVAEGSTELDEGMNVVRTGDTVTVNFNTAMLRTRRPEKFEEIVRRTLAIVYGPKADSILAAIPSGSLVQVQDLFAELPTRGLRIAIPAGGAITLWPQTWERSDGPLVIAYRATVAR